MRKKKLTYEQAYNELQQIIENIENGNYSLDEITEVMKKAKELFNFCYAKLRDIKKQVEDIVSEEEKFLNSDEEN